MRRHAAFLLILAAACAPAPQAASAPAPAAAATVAPAASIAGTWRLTQVNGHDLPTPSPGEANVTMEGATLALNADGSCTLSATAHGPGEPAQERSHRGTWTAQGGTLTITPTDGGSTINFAYTLAGNTLTLRDPQGAVFTLARS
ncbi:MAG TPA: lipocalin family protein [Longimicrobiaceae bacterium]